MVYSIWPEKTLKKAKKGKKEAELSKKGDLSILQNAELIEAILKLDKDKIADLRYKLRHIQDLLDIIEKPKEILIPVSVFENRKLSTLELVARYLKEEKQLSFSEIAAILNRSQRNIWLSYQRAKQKQSEKLKIPESKFFIPASRFADLEFSMLEHVVSYLKETYQLSLTEISVLIHRSLKTVWTVDARAKKKRKGGT